MGSTTLPTTATHLSGAIQELHTAILTKATAAKASANAEGVAGNTANIDSLRTALEDAKATDAGNHALALQAVQTEASRAEARDVERGAMPPRRLVPLRRRNNCDFIQGGSGSTDPERQGDGVEGSLAALQTLISNQRTLIVANRQDMRGTDLGVFSEIVVLPGGTLVVAPAQEGQIRTKTNAAGQTWTLVFRNDGDLEVVAAEPYDIRPDLPYLFTRLTADATVHMRGDQFLALSPTGTVAVDVASNVDLRGAPVSVNTTVNVLSGARPPSRRRRPKPWLVAPGCASSPQNPPTSPFLASLPPRASAMWSARPTARSFPACFVGEGGGRG